MRRLSVIFGAIALACMSIALPACTTAQTEKVTVSSGHALQLANRSYITVNALAQAAIKNGVIAGADLDRVEEIDKKINSLLDDATKLRSGAAQAAKAQEALDLIFELESMFRKPKEGPGDGIRRNNGTDISGRGIGRHDPRSG